MRTTPRVTLADFFRTALFNTVPDDLRRGRYASNVLSRMHPDIAKAIHDTAADPFHFDGRMPEFLARVAELWGTAECGECGRLEEIFGDGLCRICWARIVKESGGNPIAAFLPEPGDGGRAIMDTVPDEPAEPAPVKMLQYELEGQAQGWITVGLGTRFNPLDPKPEDINVGDIARALSRLPRYGGHGRGVISVAEHSVLLTDHVERTLRATEVDCDPREMLAVLHHDDAEAYIGDMRRPIKHGVPGLLAIYEALEGRILDAIHAHLGIERWEKTAIYEMAKGLDRLVVFAELPALFATDPGWQPGSAEGYEPECWIAEEAERRFLAAHEAWGGTVPASPERAES